MSSISKYSRVPFKRGKPSGREPNKDRIALFLKGYRRPDEAIFPPDARQPESESQQLLRSLDAYK
jgi:hypothetical protein